MARAEARELCSRYATLLSQSLEWEFQPERRSHSWAATITRERDAIPDHLDENPGLKPRQAELFGKAYRGARADAAAETNLPLTRFPVACPARSIRRRARRTGPELINLCLEAACYRPRAIASEWNKSTPSYRPAEAALT